MTDVPDIADHESAIEACCAAIDSSIASGNRSEQSLSALEAQCRHLGRLCATHSGDAAVTERGFAVQVRGLTWLNSGRRS
jgi:hypothetical protein